MLFFFFKFITKSAATEGKTEELCEKFRRQSKKEAKPVRNSLLNYSYNFPSDILLFIEHYSCGERQWEGGERGEWKNQSSTNTFKIIKHVSQEFVATVAENSAFFSLLFPNFQS